MHVQIKHSLAYLQDLIPSLSDVFTPVCFAKVGINLVDMLENAIFVQTFGYIHVFEPIVYR